MRIAITGATGSLGTALVAELAEHPEVQRIVAISRDEVKSGALAERFSGLAALRCQLGDVRDGERMEEVFRGCDVVVHCAALKQITHSVYSPGEMVKTNVLGTMRVIHAATEVGVGRVLVVSSDKATEPANLYGMTKAVAECYAVQGNSYSLPRGTRVACVRYGNVLGSRGSVVHVWRDQLRRGAPLTITEPGMTRFILTLRQAVGFCLAALADMEGGEIFVPRLPAVVVSVFADSVEMEDHHQSSDGYYKLTGKSVPSIGRMITGLRPGGEKLHEALLSREEPGRTWWDGARMTILPSHHSWREKFDAPAGSKPVAGPYTSDAPDRWLSVEALVEMLKEVP